MAAPQSSLAGMDAAPARRPWTRVELVFAWTIFPVLLTAAIMSGIALIESGTEPFQATLTVLVPAIMLLVILARYFPYEERWNRSHGDAPVDTAHFFTFSAANVVTTPFMQFMGTLAAAGLTTFFGADLWPVQWPLLGQLALALVIGEFVQYWVHRLEHEWDFLWRFHATHHSAPRLYWLNAARFHFFDIVLNGLYVVPLVALGAPLEVFALWLLFTTLFGVFQHSNLKVRLGPLNYLFSMAELHRWHHSKQVIESNTNYGQNLAIWDVVFGTRFLPADREPPTDIGMTGLSAFPMTYLGQLASPLRWNAIKAASQPTGGTSLPLD